MKAVYFDTRTLARNNVEVLNGKFKDFGTDAPKGERWAVLVQEVETVQTVQEQHTDFVSTITREEAINTLNRPGSIIGEQILKTANNKPVRTMWRRSVERAKMAHLLAQTL